MATPLPDLDVEDGLFERGFQLVAGLDEVGRGAWAGPVSVGIVTLRRDPPTPPPGIKDSKLVARARRQMLAPAIEEWAHGAAVGSASARECDELGMRAAVALAASRALDALEEPPDAVIVDGPLDLLDGRSTKLDALVRAHRWRQRPPVVEALVKADLRCLSVAAASIVAKVHRDQEMALLAGCFPAFDFDSNAGYPSPGHQRALAGYGLTPIHRRSWAFTDSFPLLAGQP